MTIKMRMSEEVELMTGTISETRQLSKSYGNFALKDINITVNSGEIHGLVGNNGAGKTTMLKSIMQMFEYDG